MYEYKIRTLHCRECVDNKFPLEHSLSHQTGLSVGIIRELNLSSVQDVEDAFHNAKQLTSCYILLDGRKTRIREDNKFLYPKDMLGLIDNFYFEDEEK